MDSALILADQILTLIRNAGISQIEAFAALRIASSALTAANDIAFSHDLQDSAVASSPET